jgi:crotonobetainyl-CoA:carnitine CoA-transferase CaiB-like acyl-CoA transferase
MDIEEKGQTTLGSFRVLDLTDDKGFYCGQLLGILGADIIKIERPGGDAARNFAPFFHGIPNPEKSLYWLAYNTNKRGVTLNIETADGKDIFKKLLRTADIVIETFTPGYLDKLGLGYSDLAEVNPKIIMTSITPFGQNGPYANFNSSDLVCWSMSGLLFVTGDPDRYPVRVSHIPLTYLLASMDGALATSIALYWRNSSGRGQHIDVSIQDSANKTAWMVHERWAVTGEEYPRGSSFYSVPNSEVKLRLVWSVKDGHIFYMIYTGAFGAAEDERLVNWLDESGMADDYLKGIEWNTLDWRTKSGEEGERIQNYFARFFATKTKAELLTEALKRRIMIQPLSSARDLVEHPHLQARDYWQDVEYPHLGVSLRYPIRFCLNSETPIKHWRRAPITGEHNLEIYQELGYSASEIISLKAAGII